MSAAASSSPVSVESSRFGSLKDGRTVAKIVLRNLNGLSATFITYGAALISVQCPDKDGAVEEVSLNYSTLDDFVAKSRYYGVTTGRVANRIRGGNFTIDGKTFQLACNNGVNALHGGVVGFDKVVWEAKTFVRDGVAGVTFTYRSHDGEEGYPGNLNVEAEYTLSSGDELGMTFRCTTDAATPVNLCNHAYWNLSGDLKRDVKEQLLTLNAPYFLPVDATQIPTGETAKVAGTPMDFTTEAAVGSRLFEVDGGGEPGYDHCFGRIAAGEAYDPTALAVIADLRDPVSGRRMTVSTTQPGVQLYTGNFLKGAAPHAQHHALCLETQHYPNSINETGFPSVLLRPGETYEQRTIHAFSW